MRRQFLKVLCMLGLYPSPLFTLSPFKTYEYFELRRGVRFSGDETVIDLGCGRGLQALLLGRDAARVIGIDIIPEDVEKARRLADYLDGKVRCEFRCSRLEEEAIPSNSIDKIFSFSVIEHIENVGEVVRETFRILRPGGQFVCSTDSLELIDDPAVRESHRKRFAVRQYFTQESLRALLDSMGFEQAIVYPIFRSERARQFFSRSVLGRFPNGHLHSIWTYLLLCLAEERATDGSRGIFLVAKARKPQA